jgi:hypothetical protein
LERRGRRRRLEIYLRGRNLIFVFPTNDKLTAVFIGWEVSEFARIRRNIAANFMDALERVPDLAQRIRFGKQEERFYGTADLPNFFRKPYGPVLALVGDAGCHKDPCMALGICDAFPDAELLACAIDEGLSGRQPLPVALGGYEEQRHAASMRLYHENAYQAQFKPVPEDLLAIRAAIREDQEKTNRFYLARQGMIPPQEFFNPENLRRLMARKGRSGPNVAIGSMKMDPLGTFSWKNRASARFTELGLLFAQVLTVDKMIEQIPNGQWR